MTDDLLGKIFHHLCERGPLSLRHLLFVSGRFYSVIVKSAHLWTTISLDSFFLHYFRQRPEQGNRFVELCLLRSDPLLLCLYIGPFDIDTDDSPLFLPLLKTFGKPEWRDFQRCTSLTWEDAIHHKASRIRMFVDLLPRSLPSLKHISFTGFKDPIGGSRFPNCPVLERVEILDHQRPSPYFWGTNFLRVISLTIGYSYHWIDIDLATLSLFPVLRDLKLFTVCGTAYLSDVNHQLPVIFENLHILRAHGRIPREVLTTLVAPDLEELHLEANTDNFTSTSALRTSFHPLCRDIHALLPEAVSTSEPEWATNLSNLVQKCTRLKSLYISRWMEEQCNEFMSGQDVVLHVQ